MTTVESSEDKVDAHTTVHKIANSEILTVLNRTVFPVMMTLLLGIIGWQADRALTKLDGHGDRLVAIETIMTTNKPSIEAIPGVKTDIASLRTSIEDAAKVTDEHRVQRDASFAGLQNWVKGLSDDLKRAFGMIDLLDKRLSIEEAIESQAKGHH
jgi:hypothetical protein